jgi:ArsR family transcriptional regulator, arsenate/arsenite/antimonite-responsive transcriptional repressor
MANSTYHADLDARAALFTALGHPVRLLILNLVRQKTRHGEELAAILNLNPATISHHLSKLMDAGLLSAEKDQYYQVYSLRAEALKRPLAEVVFMPQPDLNQPGSGRRVEEDAYRQKVLTTFMLHGRVKQLPAQQKKRLVILEHLAQAFEPGREYSEREVTVMLLDYSDDPVTLRRLLVEHGLMQREQGIYRRTDEGRAQLQTT